ncbi:helix-turn-helix domain-containing protein [Acetonema longum]|uniref:Putative phage regulatory protein n=1 Tax=Acetonema longum DSM 6540 TaxID=1009370 RepID=F7NKF3_9FIRM|nr:helix-turn-helix transcriptional regulator [Acetonema longum]EGO63594.1 putative phage regulatory protein [Acetonema longum DSM 6540]
MKFGDKVKHARELLQISQEELATKVGATQSYITHIENNRRTPKIEKVVILARALNVPPSYLLDDAVDASNNRSAYNQAIDEAIAAGISPEKLKLIIRSVKRN